MINFFNIYGNYGHGTRAYGIPLSYYYRTKKR